MSAISEGLTFISSVQRADGSFKTFSSPSKQPFICKMPYVTTFAQAIILTALAAVPAVRGQSSEPLRARLAAWLLKQRSASWSFNYWPRGSAMAKRLPYPDDLDDTFCALMALRFHDASLVNADCLGKVVKLLIATESQTGGPYQTWLVPPTSDPVWRDVDLAVNSNVAGFLQLVAGPLPNVTRLMEQAITDSALTSVYYPSVYPIVYYLARAYKGPAQAQLAEYILRQQRDGHWETPLHTALAISSLTQLGRADACVSGVRYLRAAQRPNGSWPAEAFCIDPAVGGQQHYNGAPALTTALALEALSRVEAAPHSPRTQTKKAVTTHSSPLRDRIYAKVASELQTLDNSLAAHCQSMLAKIKQVDEHGEITLLPTFFAAALKTPPAWAVDTKLADLGRANLYGWMAYTIYDDFLENEGKAELLGVANVALRRSLKTFRACLPEHAAFQQLVERTFDRIDGANAWELANCRFALEQGSVTFSRLPRYGRRARLAERSFGHALTPLAITMATGKGLNHPALTAIRQGLSHYIIARQLSDDLHDWEEDIRQGQASYVVSELLRNLRVRPGTYALSELVPRMRRQFWHHSLRHLCATMTSHIALARRAFMQSGLLTDKNDLFGLLDRLQTGANCTLKDQAEAKDFLTSYGEGPL